MSAREAGSLKVSLAFSFQETHPVHIWLPWQWFCLLRPATPWGSPKTATKTTVSSPLRDRREKLPRSRGSAFLLVPLTGSNRQRGTRARQIFLEDISLQSILEESVLGLEFGFKNEIQQCLWDVLNCGMFWISAAATKEPLLDFGADFVRVAIFPPSYTLEGWSALASGFAGAALG